MDVRSLSSTLINALSKMCYKFRGERHHAFSCGIRWGKGCGDQEEFPEEVFKDGQGFDSGENYNHISKAMGWITRVLSQNEK